MLYRPPYVSTDPGVNAVMDQVGDALRPALVSAIEMCNEALDGRVEGTKPLHALVSNLHQQVAEIDTHRESRARHAEQDSDLLVAS